MNTLTKIFDTFCETADLSSIRDAMFTGNPNVDDIASRMLLTNGIDSSAIHTEKNETFINLLTKKAIS